MRTLYDTVVRHFWPGKLRRWHVCEKHDKRYLQNDPKRVRKLIAPVSLLKTISPALPLKIVQHPKLGTTNIFCHRDNLQGWATLRKAKLQAEIRDSGNRK